MIQSIRHDIIYTSKSLSLKLPNKRMCPSITILCIVPPIPHSLKIPIASDSISKKYIIIPTASIDAERPITYTQSTPPPRIVNANSH